MSAQIPDTAGASKEAIAAHYDLSNDFYALWLDPSMTYTCALWAGEDEDGEDLEAAQRRKLDWHLERVGARGAERLLDVGCGWGGLLARAVSEDWGVERAVGLSLSEEQTAWCEGLGDPRIEARLEAWERHEPAEPYDAIVSVEAIEAFARPGMRRAEKVAAYRRFFARCHRWLKPGGRLSLQAITHGNVVPEQLDPFIRDQIFPESDLPRLAELFQACERLFEPLVLVNRRAHYARTLRRWERALRASREEAVALVGPERERDFELYLRFSRHAFQVGACDLIRVAFRRIDTPRQPEDSTP